MEQVVIVKNISTGEQQQISVSKWRVEREQEKRTGIKKYEFVDVIDKPSAQEQQKVSRSLQTPRSLQQTSTRSVSSRSVRSPKTGKKKKSCCGRR